MKEEECLFLYAGIYFLKEHFKLRRWVDYEGKNVSSSIIHLDEDLDSPKWDTFRRCIRNDKIFDEQECGYFFAYHNMCIGTNFCFHIHFHPKF